MVRLSTLFLVAICTLVGCSHIPFTDKSPKIAFTLIAEDGLNPDHTGRPSPVVLRIYELKSASTFNTAEFFPLYEDDVNLLGADLLAKSEMEIYPGQTVEIKRKISLDARFVGLIAAYRDLENATWRVEIKTPQARRTKARITLGSKTLTAESK